MCCRIEGRHEGNRWDLAALRLSSAIHPLSFDVAPFLWIQKAETHTRVRGPVGLQTQTRSISLCIVSKRFQTNAVLIEDNATSSRVLRRISHIEGQLGCTFRWREMPDPCRNELFLVGDELHVMMNPSSSEGSVLQTALPSTLFARIKDLPVRTQHICCRSQQDGLP